MLQVATDVLSLSIIRGVALMDYNGEFEITELDRLTARFAGNVNAALEWITRCGPLK